MAHKSAFNFNAGQPSAMELAAAEQSKQEQEMEAPAQQKNTTPEPAPAEPQAEEKPKTAKSSPRTTDRLFDSEYAFFEPGKQKESRVTRTFTLPFSVDQRLTKMANLYGTQKSVIIERAFTIWADNMDKRDKVD